MAEQLVFWFLGFSIVLPNSASELHILPELNLSTLTAFSQYSLCEFKSRSKVKFYIFFQDVSSLDRSRRYNTQSLKYSKGCHHYQLIPCFLNKFKLGMEHNTKNISRFSEMLACIPISNQTCQYYYNGLPLDNLLNQCLILKDVFTNSSIQSVPWI